MKMNKILNEAANKMKMLVNNVQLMKINQLQKQIMSKIKHYRSLQSERKTLIMHLHLN